MKKAQGRPSSSSSPSVGVGVGVSGADTRASSNADVNKSTASRRVELESRLAVLDEKIAQKEQEIKDIESGKLDPEIPRLYAEAFNEKEKETTTPKKRKGDESDSGGSEEEKKEEKVIEVKSEYKEPKKEKKKDKKKKDDVSDEDEIDHEKESESENEHEEKNKKEKPVTVKTEPKEEEEEEEASTEAKDDENEDESDEEDNDNGNEEEEEEEEDNDANDEPKVKAEKVEVKKEDAKPPAKPPAQHRGRPRLNKAAPPGAEGLSQAEIDQRIAGLNAMKKNMEEIIRLALRKDSIFFDHAVTKEEAPDYCDTIKHRIDLSFLQRRIQRGRYQWPACKSQAEAGALFSRDLMLMFANAFIFNAPGSEICEVAESLKSSCIKHLKEYNMWPLVVDQVVPKAQAKTGASESLKRTSEEKSQGSEALESDDNEGAGAVEEEDAPAPATKRRKKSHK